MFYVFPPYGFTNLSTLEHDLNTRFKLLVKLTESGDNQEKVTEYLKSSTSCRLDGLIDGSKRDCASHYIFRLACVSKGQFQDYWVQAEKKLLFYRLKKGENYALKSEIIKLYSDLEKLPSNALYRGIYLQMFMSIFHSVKILAENEEIIICENRSSCNHYFKVPWTIVKNLLSQRKVEVQDGKAVITCVLILDFLASCFEELLLLGITQMTSIYVEDGRLVSLVKHIHSLFIDKAVCYRIPNGKFCSKKLLINDHHDVKKVVRMCGKVYQRNDLSIVYAICMGLKENGFAIVLILVQHCRRCNLNHKSLVVVHLDTLMTFSFGIHCVTIIFYGWSK